MMDARTRVINLPLWQSERIDPQPLSGGITNVNFTVEDGGRKYVVRIGDDIPEHHISRSNELAASRAAFAAGLSPEVVYHQAGILVLAFIESTTLNEVDVQQSVMLKRIVPLLRRCHRDVAQHLRGQIQMFWVFHILRDYAHRLHQKNSHWCHRLPELLATASDLEQAVGAADIVFSHNDMLAANLLDDGDKLWLIDWDYAGFNSPLFDLGGLASNNNLDQKSEHWLLENYFEQPLNSDRWRRYSAMKCASLLRESMWSMVSEIYSDLAFNYQQYTHQNLVRFDLAFQQFKQL